MKKILFSVFLITILNSCSLLISPDPEPDTLGVWDYYCHTIDTTYAGFKTKNSDWANQKEIQRLNIENNPTTENLLSNIKETFRFFDDGHFCIIDENEFYYEQGQIKTYFSLNLIKSDYLAGNYIENRDAEMVYGSINNNTGYLYMWGFTEPSSWRKGFSDFISNNKDKPYLIIDLRDNSGGKGDTCIELVNYFANRKRDCFNAYRKIGPAKDDYLKITRAVEPVGDPYRNKVIVLVNERSASSSDLATILLKGAANTILIGTSNRVEIIGDAIPRELPNGWIVKVPASNIILSDEFGGYIDGDIIDVDISINNTKEGVESGVDSQLEAALTWIENQ